MKPGLQRVKRRRPLSSMTSSPSTTNCSNGTSSSVATTSGKKRLKEAPDFPLSSTEPASLNARQRKPSHFGSNCHSPDSSGSDSADLASIGAVSRRKDDRSGSSIPGLLRATIRLAFALKPRCMCCSRPGARRCCSTSAGCLGSRLAVVAAGRMSEALRAGRPRNFRPQEQCQLNAGFLARLRRRPKPAHAALV